MIKKYHRFFKIEYLILPAAAIFFAAIGYLLFFSSGAFSSLAATDFEYLTTQSYSATAISSVESPSDCQQKGTGQVILITNIDTTTVSQGVAATYYTALSNKSTWTKRGKLYPVVDEVKSKIIETLKNENKLQGFFQTTDEEAIRKMIVSGDYFADVPVSQKLSSYLYSPTWQQNGKDKAMVIEDQTGPDAVCKNIVYFIPQQNENQMKNEFPVCLHSSNQAANYNPKQNFIFPTDKDKGIKTFQDANPGSEMSLGPCQDEAKVIDNVANGQTPSGSGAAQTGNNAVAISEAEVPGVAGQNPESPAWRDGIVNAFNQFRYEAGVQSNLTIDDKLQSFVERRIEHEKAEGGDCDHDHFLQMKAELGSSADTEILNGGNFTDSQQVADKFKSSPPHHKIIIDQGYSKIGVISSSVNGVICTIAVFE